MKQIWQNVRNYFILTIDIEGVIYCFLYSVSFKIVLISFFKFKEDNMHSCYFSPLQKL